jgi:hypothetical protein
MECAEEYGCRRSSWYVIHVVILFMAMHAAGNQCLILFILRQGDPRRICLYLCRHRITWWHNRGPGVLFLLSPCRRGINVWYDPVCSKGEHWDDYWSCWSGWIRWRGYLYNVLSDLGPPHRLFYHGYRCINCCCPLSAPQHQGRKGPAWHHVGKSGGQEEEEWYSRVRCGRGRISN